MAPATPGPALAALHQRLLATPTICLDEWTLPPPATAEQLRQLEQPAWLVPAMRPAPNAGQAVTLRWHSQRQRQGEPLLSGSVLIPTLPGIYRDWKGTVYFDFHQEPEDAWRRAFKIVDHLFGQEDGVGLFHTATPNPQLYYYAYEDTPRPLGVDLPGYLALLPYSLGGEHWPLVLLEVLAAGPARPYVPRSTETKQYARNMRAVVPAFELAELVACFDRVRLPAADLLPQAHLRIGWADLPAAPAPPAASPPVPETAPDFPAPATPPPALPVPYDWKHTGIAPLLATLYYRLATGAAVELTAWQVSPGLAPYWTAADWDDLDNAEWIPPLMHALAQQPSALTSAWQAREQAGDRPAGRGQVQVMALQDIYSDWTFATEALAHTAPQEQWRHEFKLVDLLFGQQDYVGIYHTPQQPTELYYHRANARPVPLGVDLPGYLELLTHSLGGEHWPAVLVELLVLDAGDHYVPASSETQAYVATMTRLFPSFDLHALVACFNRVRLPSEKVDARREH